ncbi:MAG TPA: S41 family peptidase [Bdellovibrionales bacterium]|nr:S41 family peptidase [Bdellovibrionales bacterium]
MSKSYSSEGYYRFPTVSGDQIVFVSEDDLWSVTVEGGIPRRLTEGIGRVSYPSLSKNGRWLAFNSTEEGHSEIFLMPSDGGEAKRLTYLGRESRVIGWTHEGTIVFASNHQHAFSRLTDIYELDPETAAIRRIPCGPATHFDAGLNGGVVMARHGGTDLAYWKRYRGGRAGEIWIGRDGQFEKLLAKPTNSARPFWIGDRIFFISDFEGIGNIFSVNQDGKDIRRHTNSREYYTRGLSVNENRLVFHSAGDLFILDIDENGNNVGNATEVTIDYRSARAQAKRRFISASGFLEDFELAPNADQVVIAARGKTFSFELHRGPVFMHGQEGPVRYRLGRFLQDGRRIALISDASGEESLEIHDSFDNTVIERLQGLDLGRTREMKLSPVKDEAVLVNHRNELLWVNLETHDFRRLDHSEYSRIRGFNWSPDGRYVAYSASISERHSAIKVVELATGRIHVVTRPILSDTNPCFDPMGEYLYFLSYREFDPVYDNLHFDLGFPRGCRPHLVTLSKLIPPPFSVDYPKAWRRKERSEKDSSKTPAIEIDFEGIEDRIVAMPIPDGRYGAIAATKDKLYVTRLPIRGSLRPPEDDAQLEAYDFETEKFDLLIGSISSFRLSKDEKQLIYRVGNSLRVIKAGEKPPRESDDYRRGGWIDLSRVQIPVQPRSEWRQMYREAWRLQRDHFWTEDMSKVDWQRVFDRYRPLIDRAGSRSEVSDIIWEMQGELGTSHAYEIGGDYRPDADYGIGFLGVETEFDETEGAYRITEILRGDLWDETGSSPLARAGVELTEGDLITAIDGQRLTREIPLASALLYRAGRDVAVTFRRRLANENETRSVRALRSDQKLRYREWVERNRELVHRFSRGRFGYVHIPNMGPFGFSEFHRSYLSECSKDGLVIDVRFNGGGNVSQLLLEKLTRHRIGYSKSRWFGVEPWPVDAPAGPMVALTNEYAGSDGDIFSHAFKLLRLGPLIGKRTWGGVIGISPSHSLVDGGMTTQPEYSFWFSDVGWRVENYGAEPDIEVEFSPGDYVKGRDPQLLRGIEALEEILQRNPLPRPDLDDAPDLSLPLDN